MVGNVICCGWVFRFLGWLIVGFCAWVFDGFGCAGLVCDLGVVLRERELFAVYCDLALLWCC